MIIINGVVLAIVPKNDPVMRFMREYDPDHVEVLWYGTMYEVHRTTTTLWGMSLESAEMTFKGTAEWVCPD